MEFARPAGALALLAVPVIVWLHRARRRAPETVVASLQPWAALVAPAPRRRRVPPSALLALRLAAATAFAFALLDPRSTGVDATLGPERVAVFLDTSSSMAAGVRWNAARAVAAEEIASADGPVSIFTLGPRPRAIAVDELDRGLLARSLDALGPGGTGFHVPDAVALARAVLDGRPARLVVVTDLPSAAAPELAELVIWRVVGEPEDNLAVVGIHGRNVGGRAEVAGRVANFGRAPAEVVVDLELDGAPEAEARIVLQPRSSRDLEWTIGRRIERARIGVRSADGVRDALPDDDEARIDVARPAVPVQVVGESEAFERALRSLEGVSIERAGLGTLRSPGEGGVAVIVGRAPTLLPDGGIVLVPDSPSRPPEPASQGPETAVVRFEGAGLHPLVRGLALAGAAVGRGRLAGPAAAPGTVVALEAGGQTMLQARPIDGGRGRMVELGFVPDRGDLRARAAFPLLVARIVSWVTPPRPPAAVPVGTWVPMPSWPMVLTGPEGRVQLAGYGTDRLDRPGWYALRAAGGDAPAIDFGVNAGDPFESDLAGGEDRTPAAPESRAGSIEWWWWALAFGFAAVLAEGLGARTMPSGGRASPDSGRRAGANGSPGRRGGRGGGRGRSGGRGGQ